MSEFWQELQAQLGGTIAEEEGEVTLLFGDLPNCEFTALGNAVGVQVVQLEFSEGENPETVRDRLTSDDELSRRVQQASLQLNGQTAFFMPEQLNWYWRPTTGKPPKAKATGELITTLAQVLTRAAPMRDHYCWGCGELECGLTRHKRSTVRLCPACLTMLDQCGEELGRVETTELEPEKELDLSPLGLENLSPSAQLAKGRRLEELFQKSPGSYWLRVLFLVALGQVALFGAAGLLAILVVALLGLFAWSAVTGHVGPLILVSKGLAAGGGKLAAAAAVGLGALAKGLWPPKVSEQLPDIMLERQDQPELFGWLDGLASRVGAPRVDFVAVDNQINAFATERRQKGKWVRMVGVGVPLLELLDREELSAVMAHELGHLRHKDTRTLWVNRTAWMWVNVVDRLGKGLYSTFARWYLPLFWLYSQVLSRQQERAADAASTEVVPAEAQARQLVRIEILCQLLPAALHESLNRAALEPEGTPFDPVRRAADELDAMPADRIADAYRQALEEETNWMSTHPELRQRLQDLGVAPPAQVEMGFAPAEPAAALLRNYAELRSRATRLLTVKCQVKIARERRFYRGRTARAARLAGVESEHPTGPGQVLLGRLLCSLQRWDEAWLHLRRAVELDPGNLSALLDLVGSQFEERQYRPALEALEAYLPANALDVDLLSIGARCAERCAAPEQAREYFRRLLTMDLPLSAREDIQARMARL